MKLSVEKVCAPSRPPLTWCSKSFMILLPSHSQISVSVVMDPISELFVKSGLVLPKWLESAVQKQLDLGHGGKKARSEIYRAIYWKLKNANNWDTFRLLFIRLNWWSPLGRYSPTTTSIRTTGKPISRWRISPKFDS